MNHLKNEKSPYLSQHASNPVNWYPWSEEAFQTAASQNKLIFLSIGYSTCHWCHVMEQESFEDLQVASVLNQNYVSIKVDREERPDIDSVYMTVCQMLTGSGGWPLTILMTPDQIPFWAGTYLPKTSRMGQVGLLELLPAVARVWNKSPQNIYSAGKEIMGQLKQENNPISQPVHPNKELLHHGVYQFRKTFDPYYGGFGQEPKFPAPHNLLFLLRYSAAEHSRSAQNMAEHTLVQMYRGGIFDHVGGGFSRYSTDNKWLVPHFEKMLYDNALLAYVYLEAFQLTNRTLYKTITKKIFSYVSSELTDEKGGFYCGQDADSDGIEGKYYVFTPKELQTLFGVAEYDIFRKWFQITPRGNFEGKNIPNLIDNPYFEEENPKIDALCKKLYEYRKNRTFLHKDDKILTSWNALMIAAFAKAARLLNSFSYLYHAKRAEEFIASHLTNDNGQLFLRYRNGESKHDGQLDDYAFYAFSLLELYQTTFEIKYLEKALRISEKIMELFGDEKNGGLFFYASNSEQLITRPKEIYDGAIPSGNSVAAIVFNRLAKLTGEPKWQEISERQLSFLAGSIQAYPSAYSMSLIALSESLYPSYELVCTSSSEEAPEEFLDFLNHHAPLNLTVHFKNKKNAKALETVAAFTAHYPIPENGSRYYLCQDGSCQPPVEAIEDVSVYFPEIL